RLRAVDEGGIMGALNWGDLFFDIEANQMAASLYGEAVARIVENPETAKALTPSHPFACKRPIIDQGYYETFNRDNVTLVDLRSNP
ncbi:cyclohexanone monooxygenase, partial [Mycobacterium sp. ITM-2017-0098]